MSIPAVSTAFPMGDHPSARLRSNIASESPQESPQESEESFVENAADRGCVSSPAVAQIDGPDAPHRHYRPAASFVAHLVATFHGLPQTRHRGRASGHHAAAAYHHVQLAVTRADLHGKIGQQQRLA